MLTRNGRAWWALLLVLLGFVLGLLANPPREVETRERVQLVEVLAERAEWVTAREVERTEDRVRVVYREKVTTPDGTVTEREHEIEGEHVENREQTNDAGRSETIATKTEHREASKVIAAPAPAWRVSALAGVDLGLAEPPVLVYGGQVERRLVGPLSVGAWGMSNGAAGASVSLQF